MPIFNYSAAERSGKTVKGEREAKDEKELAHGLKKEGLLLLEAKTGKSDLANLDVGNLFLRLKPISIVDKMFFARNLSVMISAGLPFTRALEALSQETANPKFKKIIDNINTSVLKGKSFADSLKEHRQIFGDLFINMVEVGDISGKLARILGLLANQMKKDYSLLKKVRGALIYPGIILIVLATIGVLMMIYVVPTFTETIKELGGELPLGTRIIIGFSNFFINNKLLLAIGFLMTVTSLIFIIRTRQFKENFGRVILKVPLFGPLVKKVNTARFCRSLFYLITAGVPIIRSLEITASVLGNTIYRQAALETGSEIQKGQPMNKILAKYPHIFQPLVIQMINVGEETGKMSSMLLRLALFFEEEVNNTTKNLSTIIEPLLMIVVGIVVAFFIISMLQPIYSSVGNL